ncbi:MAG: trypsin-like peptidase domain-containing protein [Betaproteobacteria bacterium]
MFRKFWLLFAQAVTVVLAVLMVINTLKPDLLHLTWPQSSDNLALTTLSTTPIERSPGKQLASFSAAVKRAMPSVVSIYTSKEVKTQRPPLMDDPVFRYFFGGEGEGQMQKSSALGSGVIVNESGLILTNAHVVEAADEIEVALSDNRRTKAKLIGTDPESDLAVIKIDLPNLPTITFGANEQMQVGDVVLAIGNPFGVGQTVTMGIISALSRNHLGINTFENFIQTDAAINPGNSGGALIDINGNMVGLNTAIYSRTPGGASLGIGFAIPASTAKNVLEQLVRNGSVIRGWIGVSVQDLSNELAQSFKLSIRQGALISGVMNDSPAAKAGIKTGDVLVAINDKVVTDSTSMLSLISGLSPGSSAQLKLIRSRKDIELKIVVGKRPKPQRNEN